MHYEINISLNGEHFFATHERSLTNERRAKEVFLAFKEHFKKQDGYTITVTKWESVGEYVGPQGMGWE